MSGDFTTVIGGILTLLGAGGGLVALLTVRATRRRIVAESEHMRAQADETIAGTVKVLLGGAADLVQPLQRQLEAAEVRADRLDEKLRRARRSVDELEAQVQRVATAIHDPHITVDRLREIVPKPTDRRR